MNLLVDIDSKKFSLNGIQYFKNYISNVSGNSIKIINAYDSCDVLLDWTLFSDVSINGTTYLSVALLQENLIDVCYNRSVGVIPNNILIQDLTTYTSILGVSTEQILSSRVIPANYFINNDFIEIEAMLNRTTSGFLWSIRAYINTLNTLTGATLIGAYTGLGGVILSYLFNQKFIIKSGFLKGRNATRTSATTIENGTVLNYPYNSSINQFIIITVTMNAIDTATQECSIIKKIN